MFKSDKRKYLNNFLENHKNLNQVEKKLILDTIDVLNNPKSLQYHEIKVLTNKLETISNGNLSDDGRVLLKELHRQDWFYGILYNLRILG